MSDEPRRLIPVDTFSTGDLYSYVVADLSPPIRVGEAVTIAGTVGEVLGVEPLSRAFVAVTFAVRCLGCGVLMPQRDGHVRRWHSPACRQRNTERRPGRARADPATPGAVASYPKTEAQARAIAARTGKTKAEVKERAIARARRYEQMWAAGMNSQQIAAAEGTSPNAASVAVCQLRNQGYDLPRRQRKRER